MIISRKKYEKLNDDLIDAKTKVDDAKKSLDEENKIMRATLLIKKQRDQYKAERDTLIDDLSWYKAKVSRLERENEDLKFTKKMHLGYIKYFSNNNELLRDEVKTLKQENKTLCKPDVVFELQKDLQERCDGAIDLKEENTQLKESRDWDYEYIVKVNEENKALRLQADTYFEKWQEVKKELEDYQDDYEMVTGNCIYWEDKAHWLEDESFKCINLLSEISEHIGNKPSSSTYKYFRAKLDGIGIKEGE